MLPTPRTFSHIGLSLPDLDAAVKFYPEVLGVSSVLPKPATEYDTKNDWKVPQTTSSSHAQFRGRRESPVW